MLGFKLRMVQFLGLILGVVINNKAFFIKIDRQHYITERYDNCQAVGNSVTNSTLVL